MRIRLLLLLTILFCAHARAATFTVNTTADPGDGVCDVVGVGDGCTLHDAVNAANNAAGDDTINFAAGVTGTIQFQNNVFPYSVTSNISLQGPGAKVLSLSGKGSNILSIAPSAVVNISDLTFKDGTAGIAVNGGAISNSGILTVNNCVFSHNSSNPGSGGAIATDSNQLTVNNCTFNDNTAQGLGGAIWSSSPPITVNNSTFTGNKAHYGGAIYANRMTINNSTISGNAVSNQNNSAAGGGIYVPDDFSNINVSNTIIAGNTADFGPDVYGTITTSSFSLIGGNPLLAPLADNGGPTPTMALLAGSPAINEGDPAYAGPLTTDQRGTGFPRVRGGRLDIGAYELSALTVSIAPTFSDTFSEGAGAGATQVRITRDDPATNDLTVNLRSSDTSEAAIQSSVVIPNGQSFVDVPVNAVDDSIVDGTQSVLIKASQTGYVPVKATLSVTDNDSPVTYPLSATLSPAAFYENKAGTATTLNLSRGTAPTTVAVVVNLTCSDARLNVPATATIPAGRREVNVALTITPDAGVQGTVTATINASATGYSGASATATIYDADAALSLAVAPGSPSTISEGPSNTSTTLRVSRNTPTGSDLVINLSFRRGAGQTTLPATVTILAGQSFADFTVTAIDDTATDGTQNVAIQATVTGYKSASAQLYVTDNDGAALLNAPSR